MIRKVTKMIAMLLLLKGMQAYNLWHWACVKVAPFTEPSVLELVLTLKLQVIIA